jgi:hypothetical protein
MLVLFNLKSLGDFSARLLVSRELKGLDTFVLLG